MSTLGERLKKARERKGYSQVEVSKRTNINNKTLSRYEKNGSEPDSASLKLLADLYEVSTDFLLGRSENTKSNSKSTPSTLTEKDEKDIAKRMEKMKKDLLEASTDGDGLNFMGEPMSEEAIESLLEALEHAERIATLANKKYIPNKHKDKE